MLSNNMDAISFMEFISQCILYMLKALEYYVALTGLRKTFQIH